MASTVASSSKGVPLPLFLRKFLDEPTGPGVGFYGLHPAAGGHRLFSSRGMPFGLFVSDSDNSSDSDDDMIFSPADLFEPFISPTKLSGLLSKLQDASETSPAAKTQRSFLSLTLPGPRGWWVTKQDKDALTLKVPLPGLGKEHVKVWADKNALMIKSGKEVVEEGKGNVDGKQIAKDGKETAEDGKGTADGKEIVKDGKETADNGKGAADGKEIAKGVKETAEDGKVIAEGGMETVKDGKGPAADGDNDDGDEARYTTTRRIELPADAYQMDQIKAEMKNGLLKITVPKVKEVERKDVFQVTVE